MGRKKQKVIDAAALERQLKTTKRMQRVINTELQDSELSLEEAEDWNWSCMEKSLNIEKRIRSLTSKLSWAKRKS